MSKTIWYLHHYAGAPNLGMSYRPYYLAQEFRKLGHQPYIIAASYHHLLHQPIIQGELVRQQMINELPYIWLRTNAYQGNGSKRFLNMLQYSFNLWRSKLVKHQYAAKPDVIIVSSSHPFHYFSARRIAKYYDAKLIFEVRDIWPLSLQLLTKISASHPIIKLLAFIEKFAYKHSDYVVSLLPNAYLHMQQKGLDLKKFVYIPNGIDPQDFASAKEQELPTSISQKVDELRQQQKFIIMYTGAHGIPNALDQLLEALIILKRRGDDKIHVISCGDGIEKEKLQRKATSNHLNNITFFDSISKTLIPSLLAKADATFLAWHDSPLYQYGVSANKIFDYMGAAKPIIHVANFKDCDPVIMSQCGISVLPNTPENLANAVSEISKLTIQELTEMGARGKQYVLQNHNYTQLAKKYITLF